MTETMGLSLVAATSLYRDAYADWKAAGFPRCSPTYDFVQDVYQAYLAAYRLENGPRQAPARRVGY